MVFEFMNLFRFFVICIGKGNEKKANTFVLYILLISLDRFCPTMPNTCK